MVQDENNMITSPLLNKSLTDEDIDFLQELGNIGSGHAANALAELLNRRIDMSLPRFRKLTTEELSTVNWKDQSPDAPFAITITETTDDIVLNVLIIFDNPTLNALLQIIRSSSSNVDITNLSSFDQSILLEIGNILSLHYITALNTFLNTKYFPSTPSLFIESSETILTTIATHFKSDFANLILIECDIFANDVKLSPLVVLVPEEKAVTITLASLFNQKE